MGRDNGVPNVTPRTDELSQVLRHDKTGADEGLVQKSRSRIQTWQGKVLREPTPKQLIVGPCSSRRKPFELELHNVLDVSQNNDD